MRAIIIRIVFLIPTKLSMAGKAEFHLSHCARSVAFIFVKTLRLTRIIVPLPLVLLIIVVLN